MKRTVFIFIAALVVSAAGGRAACAQTPSQSVSQRPLRVALIGFADGSPATAAAKGSRDLEDAIEAALKRDGRVAMVERSQFQPALVGVGYDGSINLSRDEARRLGAAIGCDFFITGKKDLSERSQSSGETHQEALVGVMIVDGRAGSLAGFDFLSEKAADKAAALAALAKAVDARAAAYVDLMSRRRAARESASRTAARSPEIVIDLTDAGSAPGAGFTPPEFTNRIKPEYTEAADLADITATVEASVTFGADGRAGEVEIIRWAGFGLDESAAVAIGKLKFKPATREGLPISVRAIVRYNFRRVEDRPRKPDEPQPQQKTIPDLHPYFRPGYRPPA